MNRPALLGVLTLSTACSPQAPYSLSLSVSSRTNAQQVEVSYRVTEGATPGEAGDVVEQKSVVGSGESVVTASQTSGTLTVTRNIQQLRDYNVVGETSADLPLVPGEQQEWSDVPVSVLKETRRISSSSLVQETLVDPTATTPQWEELRYADNDLFTTAGYFGVAADEFLVRLEMTDLWDDLEDMEPADVTLLTRWEPEEGDVWPSANGNSLFVYQGTEDLNLAGTNMKKADKVAVYATGNVQATGGDGVFEQCLYLGLQQTQTTDPDAESVSTEFAQLDPGCTSSFVHVQQGTQWWYEGVLVQSDTTDTIVIVDDYGFEWFVEDEATETWNRQTSLTRDDPTARAFIEYRVTTSISEQVVTSFTE